MKYGDVSYGFEVFVNGEYFSSGSAASLDDCIREANHYAFVAQDDGEVEINYFERREISETW